MFVKICWGLTLVVAVIGCFLYFGDMSEAGSAPQQAAAAAMTVALLVIPYVFTRSVEGLAKPSAKIDGKTCPDCSEVVKSRANVCHYCRYSFETSDQAADTIINKTDY